MLGRLSFPRMTYNTITERQNAKPSNYFMSRPQSQGKTRMNNSSQKRKSLDVSGHKKINLKLQKVDKTSLNFKRDKLLYESKYNNLQPKDEEFQSLSDPRHFSSKNTTYHNASYMLEDNLKISLVKYQNLVDSNNEMMKNIVRQQILSELTLKDPILRKIDKNLVQSLILIGKIKIYEDEEIITKTDNMIGFLFYGRAKIYNQDYRFVIERGQTVGEHHLFNFQISLKIKCLEPTCIFWLPVKYYLIFRQQSIKNGLKSEFNHLQIALRLSFIKKKFKQTLKKTYF